MGVKLQGLFLKKVGMTSVFGDAGEMIPVTVLKMEPWVVSQVKTVENDGYSAVQIASEPKKAVRTSKAERGHLKGAGFENGARFVREIRQDLAGDLKVGARVSIDSFAKGDSVKITAVSKGKGFQGSVRRWNFAGGPAAHGSKFHRQPGSSGNRTWPGRVMPGKKFPGHLGAETVSVKNVQIVDVLADESVILVKGPVPGARNTLVRLVKE
ncbi:MAG TPA: 50S ribosomal protein L3 [Pseudobdellovibrionaceae bacterium]|nr:50S ribosomal protein L3 [Pseudobdellovibrionaceae bacterium]